MATYFVKTGGNDSADGLSDANAWETVAKVSGETFAAGDTISFNRGDTWRETLTLPSSGTLGSPITYTAYGSGDAPRILASDIRAGWASTTGNEYSVALAADPFVVLVDEVSANKGSAAGSLADGEWFWASSVLHYRSDAGNPDSIGLAIETPARATCITTSTNRNYNHFRDLILGGEITSGLDLFGAGIVIEDLVFLAGAGQALNLHSSIADIEVRRVTFNGPRGNEGIYGFSVENGIFEDISITAPVRPNADGIHFDASTGLTLRRITVDMTGSPSTKGCVIIHRFNGTASDVLIEDCTLIGSNNWGVALVTDGGIIVRRNTFINIGAVTGDGAEAAIRMNHDSVSDDTTIDHNLMVGCRRAFYIENNDKSNLEISNNTMIDTILTAVRMQNVDISGSFRNNILWNPGSSAGEINIAGTVAVIAGQAWTSDYNVIGDERTAFITHLGTAYDTLAAYQSGESQDANSLSVDPELVDPGNGQWRLRLTSTLRDRGIDAGVGYQGLAPEIGAHELPAPLAAGATGIGV